MNEGIVPLAFQRHSVLSAEALFVRAAVRAIKRRCAAAPSRSVCRSVVAVYLETVAATLKLAARQHKMDDPLFADADVSLIKLEMRRVCETQLILI
ncbi:hypothetical protein QQF64_031211 [Cirrhinus molitorella]|uniref:Centromere protein S n=1 Tax=Cirrhinus molitorella TaxID=172907 RepID=A0ABR3MWB4_9TELE